MLSVLVFLIIFFSIAALLSLAGWHLGTGLTMWKHFKKCPKCGKRQLPRNKDIPQECFACEGRPIRFS